MEKKVEQGVEQEMDGGIIEELERAVDGGTTDEVGNETVEEIEWKKEVDIGATKEVELKEMCHWTVEEVEQQVEETVMKDVNIRTVEEMKYIDNQTVEEEVEQERKEVDFGNVEVVEQLKGVDGRAVEEVEMEVEQDMDHGHVELMKEMDVRAVEEVKQRVEHGGVEKVMKEVRNGSVEQVEQEVKYVNPKEVMKEVENKDEMVQVDRGPVEEVVRLELNQVDDVGQACLDVVYQTPMQVDHRAKEVAAVEHILISQAPSEDGCRAEHLSSADKNVFPGPVTTDSETAESRQSTVAPCKQHGKNVDVWTVKCEGASGQGIANVEVHGGRCWYVCAEVDCGTRFRKSRDAQLHEQVHRLCAPVCNVDVWDMFDTGGGGKGEMGQPCCASPKKSHGKTIAAQEPKVGQEGGQPKFVCDVSGCNRSYIWLSSLKRHVSVSHGVCDEAATEERDLVKPAEGGNAVEEAETAVPRQSSSEVQIPKQKGESVRADCTHNKRAKWPAIYKNDKYVCCKCYKTFNSPQQLGGHLSARKNCVPHPPWMSDGDEQKQSINVFDGSVDKGMEVGGDAPWSLKQHVAVSHKEYKRAASPQQYMLPESLVIEQNKAGADTLLTLQREKQETWSPWLAQERDRLLSGCSHNRYAKWPAIYKNGKYVCSRTALLSHYAEGHAVEERVAEPRRCQPPTVPFGCLFKDCDAKFPGHRGLRLHYKSRHKVNDQQLEKLCVETADVRAASPGFSPVECSVVEMVTPAAAAAAGEEEGDRAAGPALQASGLPRAADEAAVTSPLLLIVTVEADEGRWPGEAAPARGPAGKFGRRPPVGEGAPSTPDAGPKWADRGPRDAL
ncbi:unnamed protein product [Lampetra planeri]